MTVNLRIQPDTISVCLNGHRIGPTWRRHARASAAKCPICAGQVFNRCEECDTPVPSNDFDGRVIPSHCRACGGQFPWTKAHLNEVCELVMGLEELDPAARRLAFRCIEDLVTDNVLAPISARVVAALLDPATIDVKRALFDALHDITPPTSLNAIWPDLV